MDPVRFEPVSFSKEEMHKDLRNLLTRLVGMNLWAAGPDKALLLLDSRESPADMEFVLHDSSSSPEDLGLDTSKWPITVLFDQLFDFAVHAIARFPLDEIADDTQASICSALVIDLTRSYMADDWGMDNCGDKCIQIIRLAAARSVLEGGGRFLVLTATDLTDEQLTIRDVALLAGMEEASVRNAANPRLPNPLVTRKADGKTYVEPDAAKAWLTSKGRYVPLKYSPDEATLDILTNGFRSHHDVWLFLEARAKLLGTTLDAIGTEIGAPQIRDEHDGELDALQLDRAQFESLARLLQLDSELLRLRMEDARIAAMGHRIKRELESALAERKSRN